MYRNHLVFACLSMALAVTLGALGAHFLKGQLETEQLNSFLTGVRYQVYHSLAILLIVALAGNSKSNLKRPLNLMIIGMLCFSVSIYLLSTRSLFGLEGGLKFLGPITPIGGLMLIGSWVWLGLRFWRK